MMTYRTHKYLITYRSGYYPDRVIECKWYNLDNGFFWFYLIGPILVVAKDVVFSVEEVLND